MRPANRPLSTSCAPLLLRLTTLALLPFSLATSVSLADFQPRASNLDPTCKLIYDAPIPGCTPSDFTSSGVCSKGCVDALNALQMPVFQACPGMTGQNLLKATIDGLASVSLCKNGVSTGPLASTLLSTATSSLPLAAGGTATLPTNTQLLSTSISTADPLGIPASSSSLFTSLSTITISSDGPAGATAITSTIGAPSHSDLTKYSSTVTSIRGLQTAYDGTPFDVMGSQNGGAGSLASLGRPATILLAIVAALLSAVPVLY